jgi:inorganic phosphate transporter, PiT family
LPTFVQSIFMFGLDTWYTILLIFCILCACAFEFINGFHDTANAVATVIYTNSLKPSTAVVLSAIFNAIGVATGGIAVAMSIVNLLPVEALTDVNTWHSVSMVLALLISAIGWNLGTWYFGIPCSSSHTLIGSIIGVGLAFSYLDGNFGAGVNWSKAEDIGISLVLSPMMGFFFAVILMLILRYTVKNKTIFKEPQPGRKPPMWIRGILVTTSIGVSWAHGSNDGQKGVGLIMMILIGIVPAHFALDSRVDTKDMGKQLTQIELVVNKIDTKALSAADSTKIGGIHKAIDDLSGVLAVSTTIPDEKKFQVRSDILNITRTLEKMQKAKTFTLAEADATVLKDNTKAIRKYTDYSPYGVVIMISLALGLGTMVGWKRIVITIGEKIGNTNLNYAQGASSQLVAASTIVVSTYAGLPVSTTQVLTGGVTGAMASAGGVKNLQGGTLKSILIAWILTFPVTVVISAALFLLLRAIGG